VRNAAAWLANYERFGKSIVAQGQSPGQAQPQTRN